MRSLAAKCLALLCAFAASTAVALPPPASVQITPVVTGLSGPVGIFNAGDGSNRLFVIQQGGAIRVVRNGALNPTPYLTLANATTQCRERPGAALANTGFVVGSEQGLLGLAFHPQFGSGDNSVFLSYSGANGDTIVARLTVADAAADVTTPADLATCVVVLRVDQDFANHNGGNIVFGPEAGAILYFGLGDGGSGGDPCGRAQTLNPANLVDTPAGTCGSDTSFTDPDNNGIPDRTTITRALLGKMLRLDVNGSTSTGANGLCGADLDGSADYAIPAGNPFAGGDGNCDEVWFYGLRNPWRWSFDRATGDMFIGDVGQDAWEEVDFIASGSGAGRNFDWDVCEGFHVFSTDITTRCNVLCGSDTSEVIIEYNNNGNGCSTSPTPPGISVTGGYRYRGPDSLLTGVYFYGDAGLRRIQMSEPAGGGAWVQPSAANVVPPAASPDLGGVVVAFGEAENGELYLVNSNMAGSTLYRIGASGPTDVLFQNGFE
jgi:glucose/arabinose dehydrogenase